MSFYQYKNPHPKQLKTKDCVVRAVALAFDKDYLEIRRELNKARNELGFKSYKDPDFLYKYLEKYERVTIRALKGRPRIKGEGFAMMYNEGSYILKMAKHVVCVRDGQLLDTWDSSARSVYTAWIISK